VDESVPLFKSHYSIGRSILTLNAPDDVKANGPDSIIDICVKNDLEKFVLIEDSMAGFLQAYTNAKENKLHLIYGLRMTVCQDLNEKTEESRKNSCKYAILAKTSEGYSKLIKIYSVAAKDGFYYEPRADFNLLRQNWSDKDLSLCVPFYDSFIFKNVLTTSMAVPEFNFAPPTFFLEDNDLPFDTLIADAVESFVSTGKKRETVKTKSVYYKDKKDFKSYLTFRCINNRSSLEKPNLDHMCSDEFCLESWKEQN
jgi:DNA polymerase-3 subunit alpha